jgi:hypothetical protein
VVSNQQQFGLLGVAFTLFSWLSACALVIVVATVIGAVVVDDPGRLERFILPEALSSLRPAAAGHPCPRRTPGRGTSPALSVLGTVA